MEKDKDQARGICILQWNAFSILAHGVEFKHYLDSLEHIPDVICLQETFLKESSIVNLPGYMLLRRDGTNRSGGEAYFIRKEISYSGFEKLKTIERISVKIPTVKGDLEIVNIYWSLSQEFQSRALAEVFQRDIVLICGDFNAKGTLWASKRSDGRGKRIENILKECDKVVLNRGAATRVFRGGESHLDLAFSSPGVANMASWEVLDYLYGSDHSLIQIEL